MTSFHNSTYQMELQRAVTMFKLIVSMDTITYIFIKAVAAFSANASITTGIYRYEGEYP